MIRFQTVDASNTSVTILSYQLGLVDGLLGLQELQYSLNHPTGNQRYWTLSIQTSDVVAALFFVVVVTFVIDHYFFESRYLRHVGGLRHNDGATRTRRDSAALEKGKAEDYKSSLVSGVEEKTGSGKAGILEAHAESGFSPSGSGSYRQRVYKVLLTLAILLLALIPNARSTGEAGFSPIEEAPRASHGRSEAEGGSNESARDSRSDTAVHGSFSGSIKRYGALLLASLCCLYLLIINLIFWPVFLLLHIAQECAIHEHLYPGEPVRMLHIALKSILKLAIWMTIGILLLTKPSRFQRLLWKCIRWIYAIDWWLYWGLLESYIVWAFIAKRIGSSTTGILPTVLFVTRPLLITYLYFGVVLNASVAVQVTRYLWEKPL